MGSLFSPKQPAPPPPEPCTAYVGRTKPDIDKIVQESLTEINRLSRTDYAPDEATNKILEQWQQSWLN
jgi:hypothetical protein